MLDILKKRDFDAITLGWTGSIESDPYQIFHSSQIADGGNNSIGYSNLELDKTIEIARATVDEEKRMDLWHKVEEMLYQDQPYTFLLRPKSLEFVDKRIHNVMQTQLGLNLGVAPIENYVPVNLQKHGK
jgi:peptide/nickel transport system substrate-binding protein